MTIQIFLLVVITLVSLLKASQIHLHDGGSKSVNKRTRETLETVTGSLSRVKLEETTVHTDLATKISLAGPHARQELFETAIMQADLSTLSCFSDLNSLPDTVCDDVLVALIELNEENHYEVRLVLDFLWENIPLIRESIQQKTEIFGKSFTKASGLLFSHYWNTLKGRIFSVDEFKVIFDGIVERKRKDLFDFIASTRPDKKMFEKAMQLSVNQAVRLGKLQHLEFVLRYGSCSTILRADSVLTALTLAAKDGNLFITMRYAGIPDHLNAIACCAHKPWITAIRAGHTAIFRYYHGLHMPIDFGLALFTALAHDQTNALKYIEASGVIDQSVLFGAAISAARMKRFDILNVLFRRFNLYLYPEPEQHSLLSHAVKNDWIEVAKYLVGTMNFEVNLDHSVKESHFLSTNVIHFRVIHECRSAEMTTYLLSHGADPNVPVIISTPLSNFTAYSSALEVAQQNQRADVVQVLLSVS